MERDPTSAQLAAGRLARLPFLRARTVAAEDPAPAPVERRAVVVPDRTAPGGCGDVARLVAPLARQGHVVRVSDRTAPDEVSAAASADAALVLTSIASVLSRRAGSAQRIHVRLRVDGDHLLVAVQTLPADDRARPVVLDPRDEATIRGRIEGVAGRATIRTTHGGNWLALARLPR